MNTNSNDIFIISEDYNITESKVIQYNQVINNLNIDDIGDYIRKQEYLWNVHGEHEPQENIPIPLQLAYLHFFDKNSREIAKQSESNWNIGVMNTYFKTHVAHLCAAHNRCQTLNILSFEDNDNDVTYSTRLNRILSQIEDTWQFCFRYARIYDRVNNPPTTEDLSVSTDPSIFRFSMPDLSERSPFQTVLITFLKELFENNIRKYKGYVCTQIKTPLGSYDTRAWKQIETIQEHVWKAFPKESRWELWCSMTTQGTTMISQLIKLLENCVDSQFPEIRKNRHLWSFNNGLLNGKHWCGITSKWIPAFYPYDSPEAIKLDPREVSCKYFDLDYVDYSSLEDWWDIPTPYFDKVLNAQEFEEDVCKWMYVMGGRLCFDLNEEGLDKWQIIPFLKGIARSGKSTLITNVFSKFYEGQDVRTLSNNIEKKFGLMGIYDGLMFIAPEIKGDLQLEQAEFQSIVSGEDVSIAIKGEKPKSMKWSIPGILGGNEVPTWRDNSGSIIRRLMTWNFKKQIKEKDTDPMLDIKLEKELPSILQKCLRGYLEYAQKYRGEDIWNIIPKYFIDIRKQIATITNPLEHYLESDVVILGSHKTVRCPMKIFKERFNRYCNANNLGRPRFNADFYIGPFSSRDIEARRITEPIQYRDESKERIYEDFVFGVDIKDEDDPEHG